MMWFKHDRLVGAFALSAMVVLMTEAFLVVVAKTQARHAWAELDVKRQERDALQRQSPAPSDEMRETIVREIAVATEHLTAERTQMFGVSLALPLAGPPAATPIDAYFQITDFIESSRERAVSNGITIKPGERFGFSSHSRVGPDAEMLPVVLRQCAAMRRLLEILVEVRPVALLSVQRERPAIVNQRAQQNSMLAIESRSPGSVGKAEDPGDFFDLAPVISVGWPGRVRTTAFKIEFSGQSPVLRNFLSRLASDSVPFVARTVEVELLAQAPAIANAPLTALSPDSEIVVKQNVSRFRVIVELITDLNEQGSPPS